MGRRYQYRQNRQELEVEVRYERYTDSNISRLLNIYTSIKGAALTLNAKRQEGIGYYALLQHEERAYLSACLNPIGESTITQQQFTQNRYQHGWSIRRVFFWAIGQDDLIESRCFWTLLSTPVPADADATALERADKTLESAWFDWYRWWRSQL
jgi:cyanosortase A-associated protein